MVDSSSILLQAEDTANRDKALDITQSFIVQAPAGSGKTGLLTLRYLKLLAVVDEPEEVLAVTFTNKATAEMRARIVESLMKAKEPEPNDPFQKLYWSLSKEVLKKDQEKNWRILENPGRLAIKTFDSFCRYIASKMPILSQFGSVMDPVEDSDPLYEQAAKYTLGLLEDPDFDVQKVLSQLDQKRNEIKISENKGEKVRPEAFQITDKQALIFVFQHLGSDPNKFVNMLKGMLSERERWLENAATSFEDLPILKSRLEKGISETISIFLNEIATGFDEHDISELLRLAVYAKDNVPTDERSKKASEVLSEFSTLGQSCKVPENLKDKLKFWKAMEQFLLTASEAKFRKTVTVKNGFPAPPTKKKNQDSPLLHSPEEIKANKVSFIEITESLSCKPDLANKLAVCSSMPNSLKYTSMQWLAIVSLFRVLKIAAAYLTVVFASSGKCDFSEFSIKAIRALDSDSDGRDFALSLYYKLKHILVDEYQDTSWPQYRLISKLVENWEPNDEHTIFCVGDPMQAIYRFRNAEVAVYLQTRQTGFTNLKPNSLLICRNFRSQGNLVNWFNQRFETIFPKNENLTFSAVSYSQALGVKENIPGEAAVFHTVPSIKPDPDNVVPLHNLLSKESRNVREAKEIVRIIQQERSVNPKASVAILVRAKNHASCIIPEFIKNGIKYQAVAIQKLQDFEIIRDLFSLTRLILHSADHIAWASILRSPLVGLTKRDLALLLDEETDSSGNINTNNNNNNNNKYKVFVDTVWQRLKDDSKIELLSPKGQIATKRLREVLKKAIEARSVMSLRSLVEGTWLNLGGPCVVDPSELSYSKAYFDFLDSLTKDNYMVSADLIKEKLFSLQAQMDFLEEDSVQIMTMHKSKGLEFDVVIIPGLGKRSAADKQSLLRYTQLILPKKDQNLSQSDVVMVLGAIKDSKEEHDPIYKWQQQLEEEISQNELVRLLYVASTRASKKLHFMVHVDIKADDPSQQKTNKDKDIVMLSGCFAQGQGTDTRAYTVSVPTEDKFLSCFGDTLQSQLENSLKEYFNDISENAYLDSAKDRKELNIVSSKNCLTRLEDQWVLPDIDNDFEFANVNVAVEELANQKDPYKDLLKTDPSKVWLEARQRAEAVSTGIVTHQIIHLLGVGGFDKWNKDNIYLLQPWIKTRLLEQGVINFDKAQKRVMQSLHNLVVSKRARWLFNPKHENSHYEYSLFNLNAKSIRENNSENALDKADTLTESKQNEIILSPTKHIIDRTFIENTPSGKIRWIVDFKTSSENDPSQLDAFLIKEYKKYKSQLEEYARLMRIIDKPNNYPIKLALYFPVIDKWYPWNYEA